MRQCTLVTSCLALWCLCLVSLSLSAVETAGRAGSIVERVDIFKNGYALVHSRMHVPNGTWILSEIPQAVHGTLWIESDAVVDMRVAAAQSQPQSVDHLTGSQVKLYFIDEIENLVGTIVELDLPESAIQPRVSRNGYGSSHHNLSPRSMGFTIKTSTETLYIDSALLKMIQVLDGKRSGFYRPQQLFSNKQVGVAENEMSLEVSQAPAAGATIRMSYLVYGVTWAPAYRCDMESDTEYKISRQAVIRNELMDFTEVPMYVVTGFPQMPMSGVTSLLVDPAGMNSFFQKLNQGSGAGQDWNGNRLMTQNMMFNGVQGGSFNNAGSDDNGNLADNGADLHFQSIGTVSMRKNSSIMKMLGTEKVAGERILIWTIDDDRDNYGRYQTAQDQKSPDVKEVVQLTNPFTVPLTTGPVTWYKKNLFIGQGTIHWTAPGQSAEITVNKSLSVQVQRMESEVEKSRKQVQHHGHSRTQLDVTAELHLGNRRTQAIRMIIRRTLQGEVLKADAEPTITVRADWFSDLNRRQHLEWSIEIPAKSQLTVNYDYRLLVH